MLKKNLTNITEKMEETIESTKNSLNDISMPVSTTKIAITGLSRSGKTVFITSLIDQLLHQKKITYTTTKHKAFKVSLKPPKSSINRFDYYTLSKYIKEEHKWPNGTGSITSTILEFESKGRFSILGNSKFRIELIDYPGEWILDIAMLGLSYEEWSDRVINWMNNIDEDTAARYLGEIQKLGKKAPAKSWKRDCISSMPI